jgi:hypothetical protein
MPRKNTAAASLAVLALFGLTACEKQSPIVTMTAHGVVVKAYAVKYCREGEKDAECNSSRDIPVLTVHSGDTLGIDVPRSVADQGWLVTQDKDLPPPDQRGPYSNDHYRAIEIPAGQVQPGQDLPLYIHRNPEHGKGVWQFTLRVR